MYFLNRIYKLDTNTQELGCFCALDVVSRCGMKFKLYCQKTETYRLASCSEHDFGVFA